MKSNESKLPKRLHVIGICGVATSAVAIAFHKKGVIVTGSDKGFFPPVSTELDGQGINYYAGWHPEKMFGGNLSTTNDCIVIVGTASGTGNPETALAKEKNIPIYSFAEAVGKFFSKEKSIVCVGTWGKTSSSALLSFILEQAGLDPTYMFGGISLSHQSSAKLTDSSWSVFEGDEYKSSPTDPRAKFFHYKATHLLLSAISWDHADLYPTEELYFDAFRKLLDGLPKDGLVVACADHDGAMKTLELFTGKTIFYGRELTPQKITSLQSQRSGYTGHYGYKNVIQTRDGLDLTIVHDGKSYSIHSPMLGLYQAENITGCFAMAHSLGVPAEKIVEAIANFKGLKRRMEKRFESAQPAKSGEHPEKTDTNSRKIGTSDNDLDKQFGITVIDDIAHSPEKASSVLQTLKSIYPGQIITIFEPNIGGRSRESAAKYDRAFENSDIVIVPRLTKLKVAEDEKDQPMEGVELAATISKTHSKVEHIDDDQKLVDRLTSLAKDGDVIAFLGSHGFRGMIEETVKKLSA